MDRQELHNRLIATGIDPQSFDVLGSDVDPVPGDVFLLRFVKSWGVGRPSHWATYYSERGVQLSIRRFASEEDACRYFLEWIGKVQSSDS